MTPSPKHLWRGDWRSDSESARDTAETERLTLRETQAHQAAEPEPTPPPPSKSPIWTRRAAAAALLVGLIVITAVAATALIDGGNSNDKTAALPAVSDKDVTPRKGENKTNAIYRAASPAVVSIRTGSGSGTGFVIDRNGTIVTNSHVVGTSNTVSVKFGPHSDSVKADVLGRDASSDLAVVGIDPGKMPGDVRPLGLADSRNVRVGDLAIAIGNPFGLDRTATEGIVSGVGREIQAPNGFSIDSVIQTDAPINPGNSGGPLLNDSGRVIGVNSQIETAGTSGNVGVGFAVPSNTVREVVPVLARGDEIKRAYLGLQSSAASLSQARGAEVQSVVPDGPADKAGVKSGDVIISIDGEPVREPSDVASAIADNRPGDEADIGIRRNGTTITLRATLGTRPGATP
jgi:putative serine protease PepD